MSKHYSSILILQTDGNLVMYCRHSGAVLWNTHTHGHSVRGGLQFQGDGNLVLYRSDGHVLWHSDSHGKGGDKLYMQDDANLVLYNTNSGSAVWHTNTNGKCWLSTDDVFTFCFHYLNRVLLFQSQNFLIFFQTYLRFCSTFYQYCLYSAIPLLSLEQTTKRIKLTFSVNDLKLIYIQSYSLN